MLDTHVWVWMLSDPERLSPVARDAIENSAQLGLSAISVWELGMLITKGRIEVDRDPRVWMRQAVAVDRLTVIDVDSTVGVAASTLVGLHGDPADRLIAATAKRRHCALVTKDRRIAEWSRLSRAISTIW